jgi:hypothetical protein
MTRRIRLIPGLIAVTIVLLACSASESPESDAGGARTCVAGSLGCSCTPRGTCDVNLVCQANVCGVETGGTGTGGTGGGGASLLGGTAGLGGAMTGVEGGTGGSVGPTCGNAVIEVGETCDPCPTSCDDGNSCTLDQMTGSANNCNVACTFPTITGCGPEDGCCPPRIVQRANRPRATLPPPGR